MSLGSVSVPVMANASSRSGVLPSDTVLTGGGFIAKAPWSSCTELDYVGHQPTPIWLYSVEDDL
jgi:hypothetical protein